MGMQMGRYIAERPPGLAEGWTLRRLTPASRLYGANGLRTGADGRIYVAQVSGSQISAVDIETGAVESISPMGGGIVAPDDLVFDPAGNIYATEITEGRVSVFSPNGQTRVLYGDLPNANPITYHDGKIIAGELREGGRIVELDPNGGAPRLILDNVPTPNAFEVGPDGKLYFPVMSANEIWRVSLKGGAPEKVAGDLGVPDSVKFDAKGRIVTTQVYSGQVLRIDPVSGAREVLADIGAGLDNVTFVGDRIFVSRITGEIHEVLGGGKTRLVVPDGLNWPLGLAMLEDGVLVVVDGSFTWMLHPDGTRSMGGMLFTPDYPGYLRGVAASGPGEVVATTGQGQVARWQIGKDKQYLADGFERLYGIALTPEGAAVFADAGTGRVHAVGKDGQVELLASGLKEPTGVAVGPDGTIYVAETFGGRVVKLAGGKAESVVDGLKQPQGILVRDGQLVIVDALAKELIAHDLARGARETIAANLPVGAPPGVVPKFLKAIKPLSGPMGPFAGIAAGPDGTLYVSADAEGSVMALRKE